MELEQKRSMWSYSGQHLCQSGMNLVAHPILHLTMSNGVVYAIAYSVVNPLLLS